MGNPKRSFTAHYGIFSASVISIFTVIAVVRPFPPAVGYQNQTLNGNNGVNWLVATLQDMKNSLEEQTLGSFVIPTDQMFGAGDSIVLEIYGTDGKLKGEYSFCDEGMCGGYGLTNPGWYPLEAMQGWSATDDDLSNDIPLASGQMVIITSGETDTTLTLPDPMKVTK